MGKKTKFDWLIIAVKKEDEEELIKHIMKLFPKWKKDFSYGSRDMGDVKFIQICRTELAISALVVTLDYYNASLPQFDSTKYILIDRLGFI